jgi:uncharacterized protein DUF1587
MRRRRGSPALRRLNRTEYASAVRDLLGLEVDAATLLPPDDISGGFDNNAGALRVSPALLERYLSAAAKIAALADNREIASFWRLPDPMPNRRFS